MTPSKLRRYTDTLAPEYLAHLKEPTMTTKTTRLVYVLRKTEVTDANGRTHGSTIPQSTVEVTDEVLDTIATALDLSEHSANGDGPTPRLINARAFLAALRGSR